ncbi:MAG: glycosyltransferase, partial [Actinomycetota bacterium]|nr:glycosyltransferase [Actinomycetota bacterium]
MVIPTLNEAADIGALLERLSRMRGVGEVVVADGGSTDGTPELVVSSAARLVRARPGRGGQLTARATAASGDVLLFLHADIAPPDAALQIRDAVERGRVGGNFRLRYPEGGALGRWLEALAP